VYHGFVAKCLVPGVIILLLCFTHGEGNVEPNTLMLLLCNIMYVKRPDQLLAWETDHWDIRFLRDHAGNGDKGGKKVSKPSLEGGDHLA